MSHHHARTRASLTLAGVVCAALLGACASQAKVVTDGLTAAEIFQRAQDAVSHGDYAAGIAYYTVVPKNFPDDVDHVTWAAYEIGFLYHKMGKNSTAMTMMKDLLARYDTAGDTLPPGPKILAQKLIDRLSPAAAPAAAAEPADQSAPAQPPVDQGSASPAPSPAPAQPAGQ